MDAENSPAMDMDFLAIGLRVIEMAGFPVRTVKDLAAMEKKIKPGTPVEVRFQEPTYIVSQPLRTQHPLFLFGGSVRGLCALDSRQGGQPCESCCSDPLRIWCWRSRPC
jgi:hypothetical protein